MRDEDAHGDGDGDGRREQHRRRAEVLRGADERMSLRNDGVRERFETGVHRFRGEDERDRQRESAHSVVDSRKNAPSTTARNAASA